MSTKAEQLLAEAKDIRTVAADNANDTDTYNQLINDALRLEREAASNTEFKNTFNESKQPSEEPKIENATLIGANR